MKKVLAYSYLRISTDQQVVGDGIRRQMEASQKYAKDHDYELVETIQDIGISAFKGKNAKEGAFAQFLAAIDDGRVAPGSVLIVESLDRISRDGALKAFAQFGGIVTKGITIVTLMDGQVYSEDSMEKNPGQLFMSIGIMMRANEESETKSKRLKAAWQKKRDDIEGKKLSKNIPAWLELSDDRKEFTVKEKAAETIRELFDLSINGMGVYSITRHMNENPKKYPTISGQKSWNESYVIKILKTPAVHGSFQPSTRVDGKKIPAGDPTKDYFPVVVSEETFFLAQSRLKERKTGAGRKGENFANLFSNISKCGYCGAGMLHRNKGKPPRGYRYLRCANAIKNNGCKSPAWRYSEFEGLFYQFVQEVNFSDVLSDDGKDSQIAILEKQKSSSLAKLSDSQTQYDALIERLTSPVLSDTVLESLGKKAEEIAESIKQLKSDITELNVNTASVSDDDVERDQEDFLAEYKKLEDDRPASELKAIRFQLHGLIKRSIDRVTVYNDAQLDPWDIMQTTDDGEEVLTGEISDKFLAKLDERGLTTVKDIEDYLSTGYGQRVYKHSQRFFRVHFKNGTERTVRAFEKQSLLTLSEKLAALRAKTVGA
ncbi:MAG: recombinase family protein [Rhodobacteraceae bacterium]|nr:recombinase family protein [Paracoccaceae bacterium]